MAQMPRDYKDEKRDLEEFVILRRVSCTLISCDFPSRVFRAVRRHSAGVNNGTEKLRKIG